MEDGKDMEGGGRGSAALDDEFSHVIAVIGLNDIKGHHRGACDQAFHYFICKVDNIQTHVRSVISVSNTTQQ